MGPRHCQPGRHRRHQGDGDSPALQAHDRAGRQCGQQRGGNLRRAFHGGRRLQLRPHRHQRRDQRVWLRARKKDLHSGTGVGKNLPQTAAFTRLDGGSEGTPTAPLRRRLGLPHRLLRLRPFDIQLVYLRTHGPGDRSRRRTRLLRGSRRLHVRRRRPARASSGRPGRRLRPGPSRPARPTARSTARGSSSRIPIGVGDADRGSRPARRPRHGRLRPHRDDARHLEGSCRRRGEPARRARRHVPPLRTPTTPTSSRNGSVNGIRARTRRGHRDRRLANAQHRPRWRYVNVRLLFNLRQEQPASDGLRWVAAGAEPQTRSGTRSSSARVTPFLLGLWRQGAFGTGTADADVHRDRRRDATTRRTRSSRAA